MKAEEIISDFMASPLREKFYELSSPTEAQKVYKDVCFLLRDKEPYARINGSYIVLREVSEDFDECTIQEFVLEKSKHTLFPERENTMHIHLKDPDGSFVNTFLSVLQWDDNNNFDGEDINCITVDSTLVMCKRHCVLDNFDMQEIEKLLSFGAETVTISLSQDEKLLRLCETMLFKDYCMQYKTYQDEEGNYSLIVKRRYV